MKNYSDLLALDLSVFLEKDPFKGWHYIKTIDADLPEPNINVDFPCNGLQLQCCPEETISVIFFFARENSGFNDSLLDVSFSMTRQQILELYGEPVQSGDPHTSAILGEYGPWEKFKVGENFVHFEFEPNDDRIALITLMTPEVSP